MRRPLPPSLRQRDPVESIFEDIEPYRGTTVAQRSQMMDELCRWAVEQAVARPELRVLEHQDPRSEESDTLWLRLVREARERAVRTASRPPAG